LWLALQKGYVASGWELAQTIVTLALLVFGALAHWEVSALTACVYGAMLAANGGAFAHLMVRHPELRPRGRVADAPFLRLASTGGPMLGVNIAAAGAFVFDNTLALIWLGAAASAQIAIALRIFTTAYGFISVIAQSLWPAFAEAAATEDWPWMRRTLRRGSLVAGALAGAGSLALAGVGGPVLRWWLGRDLGLDGAMLWMIGGWVLASALTQVPQVLLMAVSRAKSSLAVLTIAATAGLALKYFAALRFGVIGILGVNAALTLTLVWPAYLWLTRRWLVAQEACCPPQG
jgi:O-antigen/teichoic acid export membrane protein